MFPLFSLPNELIAAIVEAFDDRPTLVALAQSCQKLHPLAEARLFSNIYIRDGPSVARLAEILDQRPQRFRMIKHLEATPTAHAGRRIEQMPELAGRMVRLKSLKVEAPMINSSARPQWWTEGSMVEYMDHFEGVNEVRAGETDRAFECLTSFTLHSHGTGVRYYDVGTVLPVFLSRTLKHVHLSCINMDFPADTFAALESHTTRTPLATLILERCIVDPGHERYLQSILSLPRALRSFTLLLDSIVYNFAQQGLQHQARTQGSDLLKAIQQQSNSLEYFRFTHLSNAIVDPGSPEHFGTSLLSSLVTFGLSSPGLSTFHRLNTFDVDSRSNLAELLLLKELSPPSLHTLGLTGLNYEYESSWRHLSPYISAIASATHFSHLRLHTEPSRLHFDDVFKIFTSPVFTHTPHREVLLGIVENLKKRASLKLICASSRSMACHPPYLYGEKMPKEFVVFDSDRFYDLEDQVDRRFEIENYTPEDDSGWNGPFSGLGTKPRRIAR